MFNAPAGQEVQQHQSLCDWHWCWWYIFQRSSPSSFFSRFLSAITTLKSQLSSVIISNFIFHTSFHPLYRKLKYESPQEAKECKGQSTPGCECLLTQIFYLFLLVEMKATLMNKKLRVGLLNITTYTLNINTMFFLISIRQIAKLLIYNPGFREKSQETKKVLHIIGSIWKQLRATGKPH